MEIAWNVVAITAAPLIALFVGAVLNRAIESRPRLVTYLGHVSALRARQHVDWAGRARFPSLVPPPDPLESSGQSGGSRTARGAYPPVQGPCRPTQCRCLPRSRRLRIVECWRRHLEVDVRAGRQGGAGRRRQLAAYRVVFGQPRQEELVTLLDQSGLDVTRLRDWAVDLSPPATS